MHSLAVVASAAVDHNCIHVVWSSQKKLFWPFLPPYCHTGVNSLTVMCNYASLPFQHNWNHSLSQTAPHPHLLEAFEVMTTTGCCLLSDVSTKISFHISIRWSTIPDHRASSFSQIKWSGQSLCFGWLINGPIEEDLLSLLALQLNCKHDLTRRFLHAVLVRHFSSRSFSACN